MASFSHPPSDEAGPHSHKAPEGPAIVHTIGLKLCHWQWSSSRPGIYQPRAAPQPTPLASSRSPDQHAYSYMNQFNGGALGLGLPVRRDLVSLAGWRWMMARWQAGETRRSAAGGSRLVADCPPGRQPATGTGITSSRLRDRLGGHTGGVLPPAPAEERASIAKTVSLLSRGREDI